MFRRPVQHLVPPPVLSRGTPCARFGIEVPRNYHRTWRESPDYATHRPEPSIDALCCRLGGRYTPITTMGPQVTIT